ncbi:hypothetical protein GCM10011376_37200 [Nocardioides flavus (ex Wang et al. 2016)]|uniref:Uncharacterized protein n=1 Tax=Nocardioides flavus (ex Wang et al. 2016) TaxID=2058780 RepID=A0ABQ3HTG1_9ACTN|nr:hypothetical protein [Nocardioides flavus (ex Wang et al. 2016)]GHE19110.1 hypothetical protein GCM10011376_37200 [Nocardioides flavus (ex Wang et al. 2016)]
MQIDAAAARDRVSLEHIDELVEIDGKLLNNGAGPAPRLPVNAATRSSSPSQTLSHNSVTHRSASARSTNVLGQRREQPITD